MGIVQSVINRLKKISSSIKRAKFIHKTVDEHIAPVFSDPVVKQFSPCKEGCSLCCHTEVSVTMDEAELLAKRVREGLNIDLDKLRFQAESAQKDDYFKMKFEDRRCVFLDEKGACRVYADRPSVCRTNAVIGTNEQCDTSKGIQPVRLVLTRKADMAVYASFIHSQNNGCLPEMVYKALSKEHFVIIVKSH